MFPPCNINGRYKYQKAHIRVKIMQSHWIIYPRDIVNEMQYTLMSEIHLGQSTKFDLVVISIANSKSENQANVLM